MNETFINVLIGLALVLLFLAFIYWSGDKLFDIIFPDDALREAQARSDVEEMLTAANKQVTNRPRLRSIRFWNF